jgi:hypothetical protein
MSGIGRSLREPPHQRRDRRRALRFERVGDAQPLLGRLVLRQLEGRPPGAHLHLEADDAAREPVPQLLRDLLRAPRLAGSDPRLLALADRDEQSVETLVVELPDRAFELEREVVPGRHLAAVGIPARADVGVGTVDDCQRIAPGDVFGQRVAAREVKVQRLAGPDQRHVRHARAVRRLGEDHAEADLLDQRFEQRAVVDAEQRIGMHQRFPPVGLLLGAPSVRVRRSPRRALR